MKMKVTSNEAAKLLRQLQVEISDLKQKENKAIVFNAALGEDVDSVRPSYDYAATQAKICEYEQKVIKLKHQLNIFNATTEVPGLGMTIDQVLILLPILNSRISKYSSLASRLPKERAFASGGRGMPAIIDYVYTNFNQKDAESDYRKASEELTAAQNALDLVNNTVYFEIEI